MGFSYQQRRQAMCHLVDSCRKELQPFVEFHNNNIVEYHYAVEGVSKRYKTQTNISSTEYKNKLNRLCQKYLGDHLATFNSHMQTMLQQVCQVANTTKDKPSSFTLLDTYLIRKINRDAFPQVFIKINMNKGFEEDNLKRCPIIGGDDRNAELAPDCQWILDYIPQPEFDNSHAIDQLWMLKTPTLQLIAIMAYIKTFSASDVLFNEWVFSSTLAKNRMIWLGIESKKDMKVSQHEMSDKETLKKISLILNMGAKVFVQASLDSAQKGFSCADWGVLKKVDVAAKFDTQHVYGAIQEVYREFFKRNQIDYAQAKYRDVILLGLLDASEQKELLPYFEDWYQKSPNKAIYILRTLDASFLKKPYIFEENNIISIHAGWALHRTDNHQILLDSKASHNLDLIQDPSALIWLSHLDCDFVDEDISALSQSLARNMLVLWLKHTQLDVARLDPRLVEQVLFGRAIISALKIELLYGDIEVVLALDMIYQLAEYQKNQVVLQSPETNVKKDKEIIFNIFYLPDVKRFSVQLFVKPCPVVAFNGEPDGNHYMSRLLEYLREDVAKNG